MLFRKPLPFGLPASTPTQHAPDDLDSEEFLTAQELYVTFCKGPRMPKEQARAQFLSFCRVPGIQKIEFFHDGALMRIGTHHVYVPNYRDPTLIHSIGEFSIYAARGTEKFYVFENRTRTIAGHHHPHMNSDGILCITDGKQPLETALTDGDMLRFAQYAMAALYAVGSGAYGAAGIDEWPLHTTIGESHA